MAQAVFRPQVRSSLILEVTGTSYCQTDKIVQTPIHCQVLNALPLPHLTFSETCKVYIVQHCRLSLMQTMQTSDHNAMNQLG